MTREEEIYRAAIKCFNNSLNKREDFYYEPIGDYNNGGIINGFIEGAKWADKTMIEKVCEWLKENIDKDLVIYNNQSWIKRDVFIDKLKKAMEE